MGLEQVVSLASDTVFSVSRRIGQLRSLLGQVMSGSLDGNRQERSRGFITIIQIAL
ncbi:hypothetical protein [Nostoc sp.]|uniref:hypothetical protein n=1 Tax=Nostoc sp. TaxID=1180 RepID=UPI002FFB0E0B